MSETGSSALGTLRDRTDRPSVLAGLVTAVLVAVVALAVLLIPAPSWTASTSLLVLPDPRLSPTDAATYYDRIGEQVITTFARVVQSVDAPPPTPGGPSVDVAAVPDTTIVAITVTGAQPELAVSTADAVAARAVGTLSRLGTPYTISVLSPAAPTLAPQAGSGPAVGVLIAVTVALLAGVVVQQGVWTVTSRRLRQGEAPEDDATTGSVRATPQAGTAVPRHVRGPVRNLPAEQ